MCAWHTALESLLTLPLGSPKTNSGRLSAAGEVPWAEAERSPSEAAPPPYRLALPGETPLSTHTHFGGSREKGTFVTGGSNDEFRVVSNGIAKLPGGAQLSANEDVAGRELPTPGCISGGL